MFRKQFTQLKDGGTMVQVIGDYQAFDGESPVLWERRFDTPELANLGARDAIAGAFTRLFDDPNAEAKMAAPAVPTA